MTPRDRFHALDETAQSRWLDPAEAAFCTDGFEKASLNQILTRAKLSKGRSYHYFADKGELFRATLERRVASLGGLSWTAVRAAKDSRAFWQAVAELCAGLTACFQSDTRLAGMVRILHREDAAKRACAVPISALRSRIEGLLTSGQAIGAVRDDLPLSLLVDVALDLIFTIDRWFAAHAPNLSDAQEQTLSRAAFTLLMAPLLPPSFKGEIFP